MCANKIDIQIRNLKNNWHKFRAAAVGARFQEHFARVHKNQQQGKLHKLIYYSLSVISILVGIVLMIFPGPAILFFLLAAGLLSSQSRALASALDSAEIKIRAGWTRLRRL